MHSVEYSGYLSPKHVLTAEAPHCSVASAHNVTLPIAYTASPKKGRKGIVYVVHSSCAGYLFPKLPSKEMAKRPKSQSMCVSQNDEKTLQNDIARSSRPQRQGGNAVARPAWPQVMRPNVQTETRTLVRQRKKTNEARRLARC